MPRNPFNDTWCNDPAGSDEFTFQEPSAIQFAQGWIGGRDLPEAGSENWWHNRADVALQEIERYGCMTWHAESEYRIGALALGSNGTKYIAITGTDANPNVGNNPISDGGTNWRVYQEGVPAGAVQAFAMTSVPLGWLKCNGQAVSRTTYATLFSAIGTTFGNGDGSTTFNLPDMRGRFVRGWDDGRGLDGGRSFGSGQGDALASHSHTGSTSTNTHNHNGTTSSNTHSHGTNWPTSSEGDEPQYITAGRSRGSDGNFTRRTQNDTHSHSFTTSNNSHSHTFTTNATGGSETRPTNVALQYCIKT